MVLIRTLLVVLFLVFSFQGCSTRPTGDVVAVSESNNTYGSGPDRQKQALPAQVPKAVQDLLNKASILRDQGRLMEAEAQLRRAQRMAPSVAELYLVWGSIAQAQADGYRAQQLWRRAMSLAQPGSHVYRQASDLIDKNGY